MNTGLYDYLYVDKIRLEEYISQLSDNFGEQKKRSRKFSLSVTGPQFETSSEKSVRPLNTHEKIHKLITFLRETGRLSEYRPVEMNWQIDPLPFVLEVTTARKVIVPRAHLNGIAGLRDLAVWVSDPSEADLSELLYEFRGTFLYLLEAYWDGDAFSNVWSGCSALQAIVNLAQGKLLLQRTDSPDEPFGRWNANHPIAKLGTVGGISRETREITTLYKVRYLTNEQCYLVNGQEHRVNDLLGYPIFIAQSL